MCRRCFYVLLEGTGLGGAHMYYVSVCVCPLPPHTPKGLCCYPVKDEGPDSLHVTVNFGSIRAADRTRAVSLWDDENGTGH